MKLETELRALLLRELRKNVRAILGPELVSARAKDAAAAIDRIFTLLIMEEEHGETLATDIAKRFSSALAALRNALPADARARRTIDSALAALAAEGPVDAFASLRGAGQAAIRDLGASGLQDASTRSLLGALLETERDLLDAVAGLRDRVLDPDDPDEAADVGAEGCSIRAEQLTDYLRERLPEAPELCVTQLTPIPGGRSKETIAVEIENGGPLPARTILRKDRPVSVVDSRAADEFELLRVVHAAGGAVAEPLLHETDPDRLGGTFILVSHAPGSKQGEYFPEILCPQEHRREIGLQLARALARLHSIPLSALEQTGLDLDPDPRSILERSIESSYRRLLDAKGPPSIGIELAHVWLLDHLELGLTEPALCHFDIGLHNIVIDGPRLTAIVDWELAAIGSPAGDIAKCRQAIDYMMSWDEFVKAYLEASGRPEAVDPVIVDFYEILGYMGGAITSRLGGSLFRSGQKRDLLTANSGYDSHHRTSRLLTDALARAFDRGARRAR